MKTKIILVDDEESMHTIFKLKFKKEIRENKMSIESYLNGKECEEALLSKDPQSIQDILVVFSDINMPQMNGYDLLTKLKERYEHVPVVMISAYGDNETKEKVEQLGALRIIQKPVNFKELKVILQDLEKKYSK